MTAHRPRPVMARCQVCRRVFALTPGGKITRHGWARLGQAQDGSCSGSGHGPYVPGKPLADPETLLKPTGDFRWPSGNPEGGS